MFNRPDITFMNKKTKKTFLIDIAVPNTHNLDKTITDKQNKYQELVNEIQGGSNMTGTVTGLFTHKSVPAIFEPPCMCYVEAKYSSSDPDSNIIYGSNSKVTITKSKKTWLAPEYIYTNEKNL